MIQVWKCDFCSSTDIDPDKIKRHESLCVFNKSNKHCFTCKFQYEAGYVDHIPGCELNLDILNGKLGKCSGWVYEYIDEERDQKLKKLGI